MQAQARSGGREGGGSTHQVALVEEEEEVLMAGVGADVVLQELAAGALRVACVQHLWQGRSTCGQSQNVCTLVSVV
jgi:hypothetical protein